MTDPIEQDDPTLLLAESNVVLAEAVRAQTLEQRAHNEATLRLMADMVEAVRSIPAPVVTVEAPPPVVVPPVVVPAAEVRVDPSPVVIPSVQEVRIVGLPPMNAKVRRDRQGRIDTIEEP